MEENQKIEQQEQKKQRDFKDLYNKNYKFLLIIPITLLIFSLAYLISFYAGTGDIMYKDVTLTGGTTITVYTDNPININEVENTLEFQDISIRILTDLKTGQQIAFSVESKADTEELKNSLQEYLGYELTEENSSTEYTGATLSKSFYKELVIALTIAFLLMALVVFIIFKIPVPSIAVIFAAFSDIVITLAIINLLGIRLSTAGIAAFLMLIGYSVDTDVMLTTRILRRREKVLLERLKGALKTGLTMTITSIIALFSAYLIVVSPVLKQVFLVLTIGLVIDMVSTWFGNASILKWYCNKKHIA